MTRGEKVKSGEIGVTQPLALTREEKFSPRRILKQIRKHIPLPIAFGVLGTSAILLIGPQFFSFPGDVALYVGAGFATGFILGSIADSYAGPEPLENLRTGF